MCILCIHTFAQYISLSIYTYTHIYIYMAQVPASRGGASSHFGPRTQSPQRLVFGASVAALATIAEYSVFCYPYLKDRGRILLLLPCPSHLLVQLPHQGLYPTRISLTFLSS